MPVYAWVCSCGYRAETYRGINEPGDVPPPGVHCPLGTMVRDYSSVQVTAMPVALQEFHRRSDLDGIEHRRQDAKNYDEAWKPDPEGHLLPEGSIVT